MFIDTHSHIYSEQFDDDIAEVIQRAKNASISKIILPDIDSGERVRMLNLADSYPDYLFPLVGLHPTSVNESFRDELDKIEIALSSRKFYGIGETGIDLYWDKTFMYQQIEAFENQLDLSIKHNLPIIIHARDSIKEIYEVLKRYKSKNIKGIMHCFPGDIDDANKAIEYGLLLGVGGVSTFKNTNLREVLSQISIQNIVLETDSPYLAPVPYRGKRNESAYVIKIAEMLANLYNIGIEEVGNITTENASKLFKF